MKIIDSFMFFNEKDIVYLRLSELYEYVDYFVINEATNTHKGMSKDLLFWKDERLKRFKNKIIYKSITLDGKYNNILPKYFPDGMIGAKEHEQRIKLFEQIEDLNLTDEDIIMISDCDEIPNRNIFDKFKEELEENLMVALNQMFFVHYLNIYTNKNVTGTVGIKYKNLKWINSQCYNMGLQILRRDKDFIPRIENGGWHYSYMGGPELISQKVVSTYDGNLESPWKTKEAAENLVQEAIKNKKSPFSQMPLDIIDLDLNNKFLQFLTAKNGRWAKDQHIYQLFPNIIIANREEHKHLLYE